MTTTASPDVSTAPRSSTGAFRGDRRARSARSILVTSALAVAVAVGFVVSMMLGSYVLDAGSVVAATLGLPAEASAVFVVRELRLPRALTAVFVGLALGAAGIVFQRLLRNPLAAPDMIGISAGASTAAVAAIVFTSAGGLLLPAAAVVGGLATAIVVYLLAWRRGVAGNRFVLVGIGVAALLESITGYLLTRAEISDARAAITWLVGSVGLAGPEVLTALVLAVLALVPLLAVIGRASGVLELGTDAARGLGLRPQAATALVLGASVVLVAAATAAAGPIAFVALMAGPIAERLLGTGGARVVASALVGAILVTAADLIAQHALPTPISTGIVTGLVGAPYIAWLLIRSDRRGARR
ncbi:iron ABC transporter permease [Agromyces protaetiae]|uniref:Iron ABC transporter permease n=1 Tax=Agromyces protaetiae TaxID=2509455 RepID=A0A4P6FF45_9MICO|nr:iron chelate uptake ABC transporter family permease subunit [Agromyces protaetiae]QAY73673.1 iron ABC transporter permease [Agromyces protaetiae]